MKNLNLDGSSRHSHQLKFCDKCETKQPPEGGIQMAIGRWYCAQCWLKRNRKEQKSGGKP
jgi:late competence protein required for DNA uptake (superfamily II DNA/RNA helicase)